MNTEVQSIERPLDFLNNCKGERVVLDIKDARNMVEGILIAFDIHINVVLEVKGENKFYRGDNIISISKKIERG